MPTKKIDKKELVHRFRTEGILDAARRVIAKNGLDKTTMEQVAEAAGISKATIYLYFKNKDDLYFQCSIELFDRLIEMMGQALAGVDDPVEKIRGFLDTLLEAIETESDFFRILITEKFSIFLDSGTEFGREFAKRHKDLRVLVSDAIKDGIDKGVFRDFEPEKGFFLLFAMVRSMAMYRILSGEASPISSDAGLMLDVFFRGILRQDAV